MKLFFILFKGLFSVIMREQANIPNNYPKWILLDGDIDPMWIESLNTVMDDNKALIYIILTFKLCVMYHFKLTEYISRF